VLRSPRKLFPLLSILFSLVFFFNFLVPSARFSPIYIFRVPLFPPSTTRGRDGDDRPVPHTRNPQFPLPFSWTTSPPSPPTFTSPCLHRSLNLFLPIGSTLCVSPPPQTWLRPCPPFPFKSTPLNQLFRIFSSPSLPPPPPIDGHPSHVFFVDAVPPFFTNLPSFPLGIYAPSPCSFFYSTRRSMRGCMVPLFHLLKVIFDPLFPFISFFTSFLTSRTFSGRADFFGPLSG